jgi:hypothetical protein
MNLSGTTQAVSQNKSRIAFYDDQITIRVVLGKGTLWQHHRAYVTK